jgi:hypothetical protein
LKNKVKIGKANFNSFSLTINHTYLLLTGIRNWLEFLANSEDHLDLLKTVISLPWKRHPLIPDVSRESFTQKTERQSHF